MQTLGSTIVSATVSIRSFPCELASSHISRGSIRAHRRRALPVSIAARGDAFFVDLDSQPRAVPQLQKAVFGQIRIVHPALPLRARRVDVLQYLEIMRGGREMD